MTTSLCLPPDRPQIAVAASLVKVGAEKNDEVRARAFRVCANFRRAFMATFTSKEAACINLPYQEDKREIPILLSGFAAFFLKLGGCQGGCLLSFLYTPLTSKLKKLCLF